MSLKECLEYLIIEANNFNAGAAWGVSVYAMVIYETVARIYEKRTSKPYPDTNNRPFANKPLNEFIELAKKENKIYEEYYAQTAKIMDIMFLLLERSDAK